MKSIRHLNTARKDMLKQIEQTCDIEEITRDHVILNKFADKLVQDFV